MTVRAPGIAGALLLLSALSGPAQAQRVEDGSDAVIGKAAAATILFMVGERFGALDPKVTALRKAEGSWVCGSVNVKNRDGLYIGERGFVADPASAFFGRVPEGPELLDPRAEGFQALERIRELYFAMCLN
ncbi:hypothetical protein FPV16_13350 [Methylobacterium sp. W2]|uniref:hypothetical protein n=1 Tax=Methylobacterium sp. W2 TaxID=2598107 RepID=UPI001D0C70C1|nr:hypothetical protein [Methylobacterium sp. W2]MCC0807206.1 hypothetical protein [Methylobacterium sp. W2]